MSIRRSGATVILTYYAKQVGRLVGFAVGRSLPLGETRIYRSGNVGKPDFFVADWLGLTVEDGIGEAFSGINKLAGANGRELSRWGYLKIPAIVIES